MKNSESVYVLNKLFEIKRYDEALFVHCVEVANLAFCIGSNLGYPPSACYNLWLSGILHDLGKLYVNKGILDKPFRLTPFESSIIQCHVVMGFNVLAEDATLNDASLEAILCHHERKDGTGYPLSDDTPTRFSQVLAIADVYNALTSTRPYKMKLSKDDALKIIKQQDIFEEVLIDALEKAVEAFSDTIDSLTFS